MGCSLLLSVYSGHPCTVYTDHAACLSIPNTAKLSGKLARWALIIQEMDLSIKHKAGTKNRNADALSRSLVSNGDESNGDQANSADSDAHSSCVNAVNASECSDFYRYQIQKQCVSCRLRTRASTHFWPTSLLVIYLRMRSWLEELHLWARCLMLWMESYTDWEDPYFPSRNCVVPSSRRGALIQEAHQDHFVEHLVQQVYNQLRRYAWWHGMRSDIDR